MVVTDLDPPLLTTWFRFPTFDAAEIFSPFQAVYQVDHRVDSNIGGSFASIVEILEHFPNRYFDVTV